MRRIADLPRYPLAPLPTPLDEAPRLAKSLGLSKLLIKRDDLTGLALGGNKPRKLEYVIGDALAKRADVLITSAGPQSNRARMTAAACRKAGLDCILLLAGTYGVKAPIGNIMLDEVLGAEIRFIDAPDSYSAEALAEASRIAAELKMRGRMPYITEIGKASDALVDVGYFTGGLELIEQCRAAVGEPGTVLLATGSGGTQAGILVALRSAGSKARVIGIPTDPGAAMRAERVMRHSRHLIDWLGLDIDIMQADVIVDDRWSAAAHGPPDEASIEAVRVVARAEGLLIDPIYVGKVVVAIPELIQQGMIDARRPVVLVNTGGIVSLFMHTEAFARTASSPTVAAL